MKSLLRFVACLSLCVSLNSLGATVAYFSVTGLSGVYDSNNVFTDSGTGQFSGTGSLNSSGALTINGSLQTFVPSSETNNLGDISTFITSEMTLQGSLVGNTLSNMNVTHYDTLSCTDTGSTGIFANDACSNLQEPSIFNIFTDNIAFNFTAGSVTLIDWNGSSSLVGSLTAEQLVIRSELTTVPLPAGAWLFLSALSGLAYLKRNQRLGSEI
ncbi:VPLPA-CTERM sorting domain-containing protein [bacterium]|nr:VPLPA-CTERM sorting domain-containing protein [bacterium]